MARKTNSSNYVKITHRMNNEEKRLFRILFEYALPHLYEKSEYTIHPRDLLKLWNSDHFISDDFEFSKLFLERAFWHLGATLTFQSVANPSRPIWGTLALFDGRGIDEEGIYNYRYNREFKKILTMPMAYKELISEGLIPECQDALSAANATLSNNN